MKQKCEHCGAERTDDLPITETYSVAPSDAPDDEDMSEVCPHCMIKLVKWAVDTKRITFEPGAYEHLMKTAEQQKQFWRPKEVH